MPEEVAGEKKAADLGVEIPVIEGVEADEEVLLARDLMATFVKVIKAFRFYPSDNPTLKGFREQLLRRFQFFLNRYTSFVFQIGEYDFTFKGKILYENRDVKSSLAFLFYKDGLRELRFTKGLEDWEIQGFLEILKRSDTINQLEDDIVTLIWEKDFTHISHLATDEFLDENPISIPDNVNQFRENLVFKPIAHHVEVDLLEDDPHEGVDLNVILSRVLDEAPAFLTNRSVYSLTSEEMETLRGEVESETDPSSVFNILDILFDILVLEKEKDPFQDAINTLNKLLEAFITLGEFQRAADLIKRVYITLKTFEFADWQGDALKEFILNAGDDSQIERIGRMLEKEGKIRLEEMRSYLVLLQANSIKPLVKVLGELKNSKSRRVICDALAESGKNSIDLFVPFLDDRRWYLARNITYILGRIGKEQAFPYLHKAFNHGEIRVRREAVQSLGLIGGQRATGLLVRALNDPDIRIRCMAAINLGKVGKAAGLIPLLEVIQAREFHKKERAEIRAFFEAVGMASSNESIPVLQQLLERKSLFGRGKMDEIRLGAASALSMIGTPEAKAVLELGKDSKDESIREACLQALRGKTPREATV
jgi:hypothetical protein